MYVLLTAYPSAIWKWTTAPQSVPWLSPLVHGLFPRSTWFDLGQAHVGQSGNGADFSRSKLDLSCQYHSANVLYSFIQVSSTPYNLQQLTEWLNNARSKRTPKRNTIHYLPRCSKPWLKDCLLPFPLAEVKWTLLFKAGMFKSNVHNTALAVIFGRDKKVGQKTFRLPPYIMPGRRGSITSDGFQSTVKTQYTVHFF